MFPMNRKPVPVTVSYLRDGSRVAKRFGDACEARRFYAVKSREGADPRVHAAGDSTMTIESNASAVAEQATTVATPTAKPKAAKKAATKKAAPKKATAKTSAKPKKAAPKAKAAAKSDRTCSTDVPVGKRRLAAVKALRKLEAFDASSSRTADEVAARCGLTHFDVYGLFWKTNPLQAEGLVKQCKMPDVRGVSYYLTAKGRKATDEEIAG